MKAFAIEAFKAPLKPVELPTPTPQDNEVLIRIEAAAVNHLDEKTRLGQLRSLLPYKMPLVLGHEAVGLVEQVGSAVTDYSPGDRVYTRVPDHRVGTFAEYCAVPAADIAPAPQKLDALEAACLPLVALTAYQAFTEKSQVTEGTKVFIQGGSGGVGSTAIQIAKALGAYVATTASAQHTELLKSLGADEVIDYRTQDFSRVLHDYDVALEILDNKSLVKCMDILAPGGVVIGLASVPTGSLAKQLLPNHLRRSPVTRALYKTLFNALSYSVRRQAARRKVRYEFLCMRAEGSQLRRITDMVQSNQLRPVIARVFPFSQTVEALKAQASPVLPAKSLST